MTFDIILQIVLFGIALSMDAFAVAITQGLTYTDINKRKSLFIAIVYGVFQALFPLIGFWTVEIVEIKVTKSLGSAKGAQYATKAGNVMATIVSWISFILLMLFSKKFVLCFTIFSSFDLSQ